LNRVKEVFIAGKNDESNVRILQQLDKMYNLQRLYLHRYPLLRNIFKSQSNIVVNMYLHVDDYAIRFFLKGSIRSRELLRIDTFHLNEELARGLLKKYPLDRIPPLRDFTTKNIFIVLVGYTDVSLEIVRYML